ncbi:hypothetical protein [Marivivens marinus]|uniref:hypothetical protein n=1 Tax=Marivivens marinus TaxID=3110173 RepID=UPI003B8474D0
MPPVYDLMNDPEFRNAMIRLSYVALFLAVGITLVGFAYYDRGRQSGPSKEDNWTMLFATWRDSLIITLLFTSQGLLYRFRDLSSYDEYPQSILLYGPAILAPALMILDVLIFVVAALRIIAITNWLRVRRASSE